MPEERIPPVAIIGAGLGLGLATVLGAFALARAAPPTPPPGRANLYGKVTDAATGNPISGVLVTLDGMQTQTDEAGNYNFPDLEPGEYILQFEKEGYETLVYDDILLTEGQNELNAQMVPIIDLTVEDFVYSDEFFELRPWSEIIATASSASCYVVFHCTITNRGSARGTRTIGIYHQMYSTYYNRYSDPVLKRTFELTLEPGESYQFIFDPRINATYHYEDGVSWWVNDADKIVLAHGSFIWYVFLLDSAGVESAHPSAT